MPAQVQHQPLFHSEWLRSTPDPSAPRPLAPLTEKLLNILILPFLPPYILYLVLTHFLVPDQSSFQSWTLSRHISNRVERVGKILTSQWIPRAEDEAYDWTIPASTKAAYAPGASLSSASMGKPETARIDRVVVEVVPVPPCPEELRVGIAVCAGVKGETRPLWVLSPPGAGRKGAQVAKQGERAVLHIHGGGFVRGHALWTDFPLEIAKCTGLRVFSSAYRLTLTRNTAFPAPLLDVLAAYAHLTNTLGFCPSNIILLGDSAGGHLVFLLARYLALLSSASTISSPSTSPPSSSHASSSPPPTSSPSSSSHPSPSSSPSSSTHPSPSSPSTNLGLPGRLATSSPWCDLTLSQPSYRSNLPWDTLVRPRLDTAVRSALRWYVPAARGDVWFSPVFARKGDWAFLARPLDLNPLKTKPLETAPLQIDPLKPAALKQDALKAKGDPTLLSRPQRDEGRLGSERTQRAYKGVQVYVHYGGRELFEDEVRQVVESMKEDGVAVWARRDPDGLHTSAVSEANGRGEFLRDFAQFVRN